MKVVITGKDGQLGHELLRTIPQGIDIFCFDRKEFDITNPDHIHRCFSVYKPNVLINTAAYTAVDKAESEQEKAFQVNAEAVELLALSAKSVDARFIHISTDFVFSGDAVFPYSAESPVAPRSVYGSSKAAGEDKLLTTYPENSLILRTCWLYSAFGHNFVKTMLRLMKEKEILSVVADQIGSPTSANGLAQAIWRFISIPKATGIFHWSDTGETNWYDFAVAIMEQALEIGLLEKSIKIEPISTEDYPTPAIRPKYSVLDKSKTRKLLGYEPPHWRDALRSILYELVEG